MVRVDRTPGRNARVTLLDGWDARDTTLREGGKGFRLRATATAVEHEIDQHAGEVADGSAALIEA
jgi:hypothetical protein